ncbi:very short patch repair endonuclease [Sphingomonas sp. RB56-2]|uniref:Very short patch repair endonuclease n=2 Tax=Sphingomonas brevis TaxID=2908206 RepID=A0ABT0SAY8_9SPHN|nr:very short patch repair endonuclease [Sphingomonas brevis]MCL6741581.1 very short patch repair endonuclease [Sphingomonas brevis]
MSGIRAKNTQPEMILRRLLHRAGFRFRLHRPDLPGKPDLVLKRWRAVIHVHGCFWHSHGCHRFRLPATNAEEWASKLETNRRRDTVVRAKLEQLGWRQLMVWECALTGRTRLADAALLAALDRWLRCDEWTGEISGNRASGRG